MHTQPCQWLSELQYKWTIIDLSKCAHLCPNYSFHHVIPSPATAFIISLCIYRKQCRKITMIRIIANKCQYIQWLKPSEIMYDHIIQLDEPVMQFLRHIKARTHICWETAQISVLSGHGNSSACGLEVPRPWRQTCLVDQTICQWARVLASIPRSTWPYDETQWKTYETNTFEGMTNFES